MTKAPIFSAEILVIQDMDSGVRIECNENHANFLAATLEAREIKCGAPRVAVQGTRNIPNWVEFDVSVKTHEEAMKHVIGILNTANVPTSVNTTQDSAEIRSQITLVDVSIFR